MSSFLAVTVDPPDPENVTVLLTWPSGAKSSNAEHVQTEWGCVALLFQIFFETLSEVSTPVVVPLLGVEERNSHSTLSVALPGFGPSPWAEATA